MLKAFSGFLYSYNLHFVYCSPNNSELICVMFLQNDGSVLQGSMAAVVSQDRMSSVISQGRVASVQGRL